MPRAFDESSARVEFFGEPWLPVDPDRRVPVEEIEAGLRCEECGETLKAADQGLVFRRARVSEENAPEKVVADLWFHRYCYDNEED